MKELVAAGTERRTGKKAKSPTLMDYV